MMRDCDNNRFTRYSLDNTAQLLADKFPQSLVLVVTPWEMFLNIYSVFSNFVKFVARTVPSHSYDYGGLAHLVKLYGNIIKELNVSRCFETNFDSGLIRPISAHIFPHKTSDFSGKFLTRPIIDDKDVSKCIISDVNIVLVGFSKGSVVLNQILYELHLAKENRQIETFLSKVKAIYWLDGGHSGKHNTWVTDCKILKTLSKYNFDLFVHVTPYQVKDNKRPWIEKDQELFVNMLRELGANINVRKHHFDKPGSIENHFDILNQFNTK